MNTKVDEMGIRQRRGGGIFQGRPGPRRGYSAIDGMEWNILYENKFGHHMRIRADDVCVCVCVCVCVWIVNDVERTENIIKLQKQWRREMIKMINSADNTQKHGRG